MDRKTLAKLEKLANLATSDNRDEAEAAARGAVALLRKSGSTLEAYLKEADPKTVFQVGLVRVADAYVAGREGLSPPDRRGMYAELLQAISGMYAGRSAEDAEREEAFRRREEELRRRERAAAESEARAKAREAETATAGTGGPREGFRSEPPGGRSAEASAGPGEGRRKRPSFSPAGSRAEGARGPSVGPQIPVRTWLAGAVFGAFAGVAGTLFLALVFAAAGTAPPGVSELPTVVVMGVLGTAGAVARIVLGPDLGAKKFFSNSA
ncbi:MAG: hypothetical protein QMC36_08135 [Patescibacteria group bacterium]